MLSSIVLALAAAVPAGDVTLTVAGNVSSIGQSPTTGPFVGAVVSDPVTVRVSIEVPFQASTSPTATQYFVFDQAQSQLAVGAASAALFVTRLELRDSAAGDRLRLEGSPATGSHLRCVIDDASGALFAAPNVLALLGTTAVTANQVLECSLLGNGGLIEIAPTSITVSLAATGASHCPAPAQNSTGAIGALTAFGSSVVAEQRLHLAATSLPPGALGLFLCSRTPGPSTAPGFPAPLCLGGSIGRFVSLAGHVDGSGVLLRTLDLTSFPQPAQSVAVQAGETWYFQVWHRDVVAGAPGSGLSDGVAVTFQ